jgi:hypothetical protein
MSGEGKTHTLPTNLLPFRSLLTPFPRGLKGLGGNSQEQDQEPAECTVRVRFTVTIIIPKLVKTFDRMALRVRIRVRVRAGERESSSAVMV